MKTTITYNPQFALFLNRLLDKTELTHNTIIISYNFLFSRESYLSSLVSEELVKTLLYLKDVMKINNLNTCEQLLDHYDIKAKETRGFVKALSAPTKVKCSYESDNKFEKYVGVIASGCKVNVKCGDMNIETLKNISMVMTLSQNMDMFKLLQKHRENHNDEECVLS
ncbi:MAG: hypothetical protein ABUT20_28140 [Bacteroidota bacterium]